MKFFVLLAALLCFLPSAAHADFAADVDLTDLRLMSLQHNQTVKTFDTYAREVLFQISGHSTFVPFPRRGARLPCFDNLVWIDLGGHPNAR